LALPESHQNRNQDVLQQIPRGFRVASSGAQQGEDALAEEVDQFGLGRKVSRRNSLGHAAHLFRAFIVHTGEFLSLSRTRGFSVTFYRLLQHINDNPVRNRCRRS
jgi:hypothetical protein